MSEQHKEPAQAELDQAINDVDTALLDSAQESGLAAVVLLSTIMNADYEEAGPAVFELRKLAPNLNRFIANEITDATSELLFALKEAVQVIKIFHGEPAWEIYEQQSPEMKRINAVIAKQERRP